MSASSNVKPDIVLQEFWRDNNRFADLFNAVLFNGRQVLLPENLTEQDSDVSSTLKLKDYAQTLKRSRDVIKKSSWGIDFVILGIESQKLTHYAMPLRAAIYDTLGYLKECNEIIKKNRQNNVPMNSDEFLSGMLKKDRIHPIVTIVIYYGEEPWNGPLSLTEMMNIPADLTGMLNDYKINLLQVLDSGKYLFQNEDVNTVFEISRDFFHSDIKKILSDYEKKDIHTELGIVIGSIINSKKLIQQVLKNKGGMINMCSALEEFRQEGRQEGILEGRQEGILEGQENILKNMLQNGLSLEKIAEFTQIPIHEIQRIKNKNAI